MTLAVKSFMEGTAEKLGVGKRTGGGSMVPVGREQAAINAKQS